MERITLAEIGEMRTRGYDRSTIANAEAWLAVCERADELIAQVDRAFDGVTLGNGIGLWQSDGIDDYCGPTELQRLRANDEKLDWRRIPADTLNYCHAAPSFLDAEGMRFHTPAFIVAELRGESGDGFIDRLIYNSFGAPDFIDLLTPAQRHAIMACISFYGSIGRFAYDSSDISAALLRFANAGQSTNKPMDRSGGSAAC